MQTYVQKQNEVREEALKAFFKALGPLKEFVDKNNNCYDDRTAIEQKALHLVADIRAALHDLQYYDPLRERQIYGSNRARVFCFNIPCESRNVTYCPENFWPDDFIRCWKEQDISTLHYKDDWFRVGDDFYKKDDYLLYNGVVYSKKEYALNKQNELVSLKESIPVSAFFFNYGCRNEINYADWLTPKDVEMKQLENSYDYLLHISVCLNKTAYGYRGALLSSNYWLSMFKFGDKRYFTKTDSTSVNCEMLFSEEMVRKNELAPSEEHHRIWKAVKALVDKYIENDQQHAPNYPKMKDNGEGVLWRISFNANKVRTSSVRDKIIRNIADDNYINTAELKRRLELLKDVLNAEAQYVKTK